MPLKIAILFGGRSPEHQISLLSAQNVVNQIDRNKYQPILIAIDKDGVWYHCKEPFELNHKSDAQQVSYSKLGQKVFLSQNFGDRGIYDFQTGKLVSSIDVIFPVLHGKNGEDGTIQGFANLAGIPCVGCGVLGSAICMDKDMTKRILKEGGVPIADFVTLRKDQWSNPTYDDIACWMGETLFIKPANLGSSVGISMVNNAKEFDEAVAKAFEYDRKVLVEPRIEGREIECAVKGNYQPQASVIGEIIPKTSWYSFENKYVDQDGAELVIPASISEEVSEKARAIAIQAYRLTECTGLARVDMFLKADGELLVNEINTLPGFTDISMYPMLWRASGTSYQTLISELIDWAIALES